MIKEQIGALLKEIAASPEATAKHLSFLPAEDANLDEPVPGIYLITWSQPQEGDRLKLTYAYRDIDEVAVVISLVFSLKGNITEMELSRGDGKAVKRIPTKAETFIPPISIPF